VPSAIGASRNITLPLLTGNDEFVFKNHIQTLTNKTLDSTNSYSGVITSSTGNGVTIALPNIDTSLGTTKNLSVTQTITDTATTAADYYPVQMEFEYLANDVTDPFDLASAGLHATTTYGSGGIDAKGTTQTGTFNVKILGSSSANSETSNIMGWTRNVAEPASMWFLDANMHGPTVQPGLFTGLDIFMNNHYNGSPSRNTSNGIGIYTKYGSGGGSDASQDTSQTYPIDIGLIISGSSGVASNGANNGFNTGIQVGGFGGAWNASGTVSKIGTGVKLLECVDNCIDTSSQGTLTGYVLKLPNDGLIGRATTGNLSWNSSDALTIKAASVKSVHSDGSEYDLEAMRPDVKKFGTWYGSSTSNAEGILNGRMNTIAVGTGTNAGGSDSTGIYRTYDTAATINSIAGNRTDSTYMMRINNCLFKAAIYLNNNVNVRVFAGFVSDANAPTSLADPLNAKEGVALWFDSAVNANWRRLHNDTSGASVSDDTTVAAATATRYTVEIEAVTDSKFVFRFNGVNTDITSNIPASTTGLAYWIYMENTTGASRTFRNYYVIIRNDK